MPQLPPPPTGAPALPTRLARLGGVATRAGLLQLGTRDEIEAAVGAGAIVRLSRGRYALPTGTAGRLASHRLTGVAVELSAAAHWGWGTTWQPQRPVVAVPRGRRMSEPAREGVTLRWRDYPEGDLVDGWVTTPLRTVVDCATSLPFAEALAVADSALRSGRVRRCDLERVLSRAPLRGLAALAAVVRHADGRAANPFESTLRAVALQVPGLVVVPQRRIESRRTGRFVGVVDLADDALRIVIEADSHEFHTEKEQFERDCLRYDELVVDDWTVLRVAWLQAMKKQDWVGGILRAAVGLRSGRADRRPLPPSRSRTTV